MIDTATQRGIPGHITSLGHEPYLYTMFYVEVDDVQAYLDRIGAVVLGGKVPVPPIKIPIGTIAWLADLEWQYHRTPQTAVVIDYGRPSDAWRAFKRCASRGPISAHPAVTIATVTPVPFDLPLRPSEAAALANLVFDYAERKELHHELRNRLAVRAAALRLETITPYFGSLERDRVHPSSYYLAVDGEYGAPLLLHMALATAPTSSIFQKPLLIGRAPRSSGPGMVINAVSFHAFDAENIDKFVSHVGAAFVPQPQGARPAITAMAQRAEQVPGAFAAFRAILKRTGRNLAAVRYTAPGKGGEDICGFYYAAVWAAIRAGWREGYSVGLSIPGASDAVSGMLREAAGFTLFEFAAGLENLDAVERLYGLIRKSRKGRPFDFELSMEQSEAPTAPEDLLYCLYELRSRDCPAQLAAPRLARRGLSRDQELIEGLVAVARNHQCMLSVAREHLEAVARAVAGKMNVRVPAETEPIESAAEALLR